MTHLQHSAPSDVVLAIDIGGTTVKGAAIDRSGSVVMRETIDTFAIDDDAFTSVLRLIQNLFSDVVAAGYAPVGIGIASPGLVEPASGTVRFAANLRWASLPLKQLLEAEFPVPVSVGHDARMAAVAERAAQADGDTGFENAIVIPIGTGVSAAVITGGVLVEGAIGAAGEFGHMPAIPHGERCACGQYGCVEAYASGATILGRYQQQGGTRASSTRAIASSLDTDPVAAAVWADAVNALAIGITALTAVLDPAVVVIGGGVSGAGDALILPLRAEVDARLGWRAPPRIERSVLTSQGGLIGAAIIGWVGKELPRDFALRAHRSLVAGASADTTSAAEAAGIARPGRSSPTLSPSFLSHPDGKTAMTPSPLRIGLIGAGGISKSHLPHLLTLGADVYVYSEAGATELVARYGGTVVDSLEELLETVDFVDVATPTFTHHALVKRALKAGKHVISEKPLARTDAEVDELEALAGELGLELYPAHVVRFFPEYVRLFEAVTSGSLGELAVLRFARSGAFPTRTPWFADRALSGGIIMDQMIHDIDIARWVAGPVTRVSAVSSRAGSDAAPVEAAHVLLTHSSGAISHIAGLWGPAHLPFTTEYSVTGTAGTLAHSSAAERNYTAHLSSIESQGGLLPDVDPAENPYFAELREFTEAFAGGGVPRVSVADGAEAVRLANAALLSLETGQPVEFGAGPSDATSSTPTTGR